MGSEVAGEIVGLGRNVTNFKVNPIPHSYLNLALETIQSCSNSLGIVLWLYRNEKPGVNMLSAARNTASKFLKR
jgi:hypothetical protein